MQRTKAELEGELSALTESLEALRGVGSGICQLAAEAATAAEVEAAAHQVRLLTSVARAAPFPCSSGCRRSALPWTLHYASKIPRSCRN